MKRHLTTAYSRGRCAPSLMLTDSRTHNSAMDLALFDFNGTITTGDMFTLRENREMLDRVHRRYYRWKPANNRLQPTPRSVVSSRGAAERHPASRRLQCPL